ncbi:unnamed protein product, partial [Chrysoparadoxa australica]
MVIPRHVAFVLDGNGRWATSKGLPRTAGHLEGAKRAKEIVEVCRKIGIEYVTLFAFSTENWTRPAMEVAALMQLLEKNLLESRDSMRKKGVRLVAIGQRERLSQHLQDLIKETEAGAGSTKEGQMTLCLAVSYGGRDEITRAARRLAEMVAEGEIRPEAIDEVVFESQLSTHSHGLPNPDLIVRTSGEHRLSNFLLWQAAYSELYITDKTWPDFREADLAEAFR